MASQPPRPQHGYRLQFGDTTLTKVFVGGLAWETPTAEMHRYFEQFGDILEAVIITDRATGKSKGYGFVGSWRLPHSLSSKLYSALISRLTEPMLKKVTFRNPESARRACVEPNPVIDGRRANCNIASQGRPRPSPPPRGNN